MTRTTLSRVAIALAAIAMAGGASAQTNNNSTTGTTAAAASGASAAASRLARADTAFLKQAAQNGHTEVEGSKLAETKATSDKVKSFARQMVEDHTKSNTELTALAASKGVELPDGPSVAQKAKLKLLEQADGAKFDRNYADTVGVKAHQDTVKLFEKASREAKDADVKAWATKTLPALKQHLEHAQELKKATEATKS